MAVKKKRTQNGNATRDAGLIHSLTYSEAAGSVKHSNVGNKLKPLQADDGIAWTTNATTIKALPSAGRNLAVYNNAGAVGSITFGLAGQASLAPGVTDAQGNVGIACPPNAWTYLAAGEATHVIASAATLLVYLIDDETALNQITTR